MARHTNFILVSAPRSGYEVTVTSQENYLKFYRDVKTFEEAREHCKEEGGDLVMDNRGRKWHENITSLFEGIIKNMNRRDFAVWLGAYEKHGIWTWVDGKET